MLWSIALPLLTIGLTTLLINYWNKKPFKINTSQISDDKTYHFKIIRGKTILGVFIGIENKGQFDFKITKNNWGHRTLQYLRFGNKLKITNHNLNRLIYLNSDDDRIYTLLSSNSAAIESTEALLESYQDPFYKAPLKPSFFTFELPPTIFIPSEIYCQNGMLWTKIGGFMKDENQAIQIAPEVVKKLKTLQNALDTLPPSVSNTGSLYIQHATRFNAFIVSILLIAIASLFAINMQKTGVSLDPLKLVHLTLYVCLIIFSALLVTLWIYLRDSAKSHTAFIFLLSFGVMGIPIYSFIELRELNIDFNTKNTIIDARY